MRRRWLWWPLALVLTVLGIAAAATKAFGLDRWPWLTMTAAVVVAVAAFPTKLVQERLSRASQRRDDRARQLTAGVPGGGRRRVREIHDPTVLGVHRSVGPGAIADACLVPYVQRDMHEELARVVTGSGFVVLVGDSGAGKSRLGFEVLRQVRADDVLFAPEPAVLESVIEEVAARSAAVLWLDDLERFVATGALSVTAIDRLVAGNSHHRLILGTLRRTASAALTNDTDNNSVSTRKALDLSRRVEVERRWSPAEREAAARMQDSRIAAALTHANEYGVAEYLAAGPQLLRRWQDGKTNHPRGVALVKVAIIFRRIGFLGPLPRTMLEEVHTRYVTPRDRCESIEKAWEWVLDPIGLPTALLEPTTDSTDPRNPVTVFDYLTDYTENVASPSDYSDEHLARTALGHATTADLSSIGTFAHKHAQYALAEDAYRAALQHQAHAHGQRHPDTLSSRNNLAAVLQHQGRLEEADQEHRAVLDIRRAVLGERHPDTLASRTNLAAVLRDQGRLEEAESQNRAVVDIYRNVLGERHPDSLASRNNLAVMLRDRGWLEEAEQEHRAVLDIRRAVLGERHPRTLASRNNLALVLQDRGQLEEAESQNRAVLDIYRDVLGERHPDTLISRTNLAAVLQHRGQLEEAENQNRAVLNIRRAVLGERHPATLVSRTNLAAVLRDRGWLEEAEQEHRAVLDIRRAVLGERHPDTLASRSHLAKVLRDRGWLEEAEQEHRAVLDIYRDVFGERHPSTLRSRTHVAKVLRDRGKDDEAEAIEPE